jgi:hypothetical protein
VAPKGLALVEPFCHVTDKLQGGLSGVRIDRFSKRLSTLRNAMQVNEEHEIEMFSSGEDRLVGLG